MQNPERGYKDSAKKKNNASKINPFILLDTLSCSIFAANKIKQNMKKLRFFAIAAICTMNFALAGQVSAQSLLDNIKKAATQATQQSIQGSSISNILSSVVGSSNISESELIGTWKYAGSDCAFSSQNMLAKAGGEIAAQKIENKLNPIYKKAGISSTNTYFTLDENKKFSAKIAGKSITGSYSFDTKNNKITFQAPLLRSTCYVTKSGSNLNFLFDSTKLLSLLQTVSAISGNASLQTLGTLSKNYNGAKMGFALKK